MHDPHCTAAASKGNTDPQGPTHLMKMAHRMLQLSNAASTAARNHESLRKELDDVSTAAAKKALDYAHTALREAF